MAKQFTNKAGRVIDALQLADQVPALTSGLNSSLTMALEAWERMLIKVKAAGLEKDEKAQQWEDMSHDELREEILNTERDLLDHPSGTDGRAEIMAKLQKLTQLFWNQLGDS